MQGRRHLGGRGLEVAAWQRPLIRKGDAEHGVLARERRFGAGGACHQRLEVAMTGVHRDHPERCEQEGQREAQVVAVVERAQQHRDQHQPEGGTEPGRQDVDPAAPQRHRIAVGALALADPVMHPATQGALRGVRGGVVRRPQGIGTELMSAAATSAGPRPSVASRGRRR